MKFITTAVLIVGVLITSMPVRAEDPVPFRAFMQSAGAKSSMPPIQDNNVQSSAKPKQTAHRPMTTSGKVMAIAGAGLFVIGGVMLIGTAVWNGPASSSDKAKLYGVGGGAMTGGVLLIILGDHHRSAK